MPAALMDSVPAPRPVSLPARNPRTACASRLAACLRRFNAAGFRIVITAPADVRAFTAGMNRFPERCVDPMAHAAWETAYGVFCGRDRQRQDGGSWRILAVDRDERVVGAITARFFCGEVVSDYLHVLSLLDQTGPVFREHCERAVKEVLATAAEQGRTPAEISHWAVAPGWRAALVAVTLSRAMIALAAAFESPLVLTAADNRRSEVTRLMRLGAAPLGLAGRYALPPFVHHSSGAWLRLLLLDSRTLQPRGGGTPALDLALLRRHAAIVSAG